MIRLLPSTTAARRSRRGWFEKEKRRGVERDSYGQGVLGQGVPAEEGGGGNSSWRLRFCFCEEREREIKKGGEELYQTGVSFELFFSFNPRPRHTPRLLTCPPLSPLVERCR